MLHAAKNAVFVFYHIPVGARVETHVTCKGTSRTIENLFALTYRAKVASHVHNNLISEICVKWLVFLIGSVIGNSEPLQHSLQVTEN